MKVPEWEFGFVRGVYPKEALKAWVKSQGTEPDGGLMAWGLR